MHLRSLSLALCLGIVHNLSLTLDLTLWLALLIIGCKCCIGANIVRGNHCLNVGELSEDASEIAIELGLRLDPDGPVNELQELGLEQVHLLQ